MACSLPRWKEAFEVGQLGLPGPHGAMDQHFPGVIHTLSTNPEPINRECRSEPQYGPDKGGESGTYIYGSTEITVYIYIYCILYSIYIYCIYINTVYNGI